MVGELRGGRAWKWPSLRVFSLCFLLVVSLPPLLAADNAKRREWTRRKGWKSASSTSPSSSWTTTVPPSSESMSASSSSPRQPLSPFARPGSPQYASEWRGYVKDMFNFAFRGYVNHALGFDELRPLTCSGVDTLGGCAVTLVDSLDTLFVLGEDAEFRRMVKWVGDNLSFDKSVHVSLFETTIRVLGGLLSAHVIAEEIGGKWRPPGYNKELLNLAEDLGSRMLGAFETETGIPYGALNLMEGVAKNESTLSSTASAGSLILEFGILSRLTGDERFEDRAKEAIKAVHARRSERTGLVGAHIDVRTGWWTHRDAGIGNSIDSYYEYMLKGAILFGDEELLEIFWESYNAVESWLRKGGWYIEANMETGEYVWYVFQSLHGFWPGLQAMIGDTRKAMETLELFMEVWRRYGAVPEGYDIRRQQVMRGRESYPLRPEIAESIYHIYRATRDPALLDAGKDMAFSLEKRTKGKCGYTRLFDVESDRQDDAMESFMLSETLKYLYLLFDEGTQIPISPLATSGLEFVFTTQGHTLPIIERVSNLRQPVEFDAQQSEHVSWTRLSENDDDGTAENRTRSMMMRTCPRISTLWPRRGESSLSDLYPGGMNSTLISETSMSSVNTAVEDFLSKILINQILNLFSMQESWDRISAIAIDEPMTMAELGTRVSNYLKRSGHGKESIKVLDNGNFGIFFDSAIVHRVVKYGLGIVPYPTCPAHFGCALEDMDEDSLCWHGGHTLFALKVDMECLAPAFLARLDSAETAPS